MTAPLTFWGLSTPLMDELFGAESLMGAILRFEAALAGGLADVGIAPRDEADAVVAACAEPLEGAEEILGSTWEDGTPLIIVTRVIRSRLDEEGQRRWVHYGSTTQDALDTAHMLVVREALGHLESGLAGVCRSMRDLLIAHRDQPQMARTFLQDASPTTFGYRVAGWLDPTLTHLETVRETRAGLAVQLGGPVGNLSAYGARAADMLHAVAGRLDLEAPDLPWHGDRSRIRSLIAAVVDPITTLAKVATDMALLAESAVREVTVRPGGSSAIPGKKNPIDAIRALAAADVCQGAASMVYRARPHELDRALGSWHTEWVALPLVFSSASAVVEATTRLLEGLDVNGEVMASRAGKIPDIDPVLIDRVLDRCSELA